MFGKVKPASAVAGLTPKVFDALLIDPSAIVNWASVRALYAKTPLKVLLPLDHAPRVP